MGEPRGRAPKNLPQRVERAGVERGTVAVWYLGGAGLILKTPGAIVYVDPYTGAGDDDPALGGRGVPVPFDPGAAGRVDAVLCTHDHTDRETLSVWRHHLVPPVCSGGAPVERRPARPVARVPPGLDARASA